MRVVCRAAEVQAIPGAQAREGQAVSDAAPPPWVKRAPGLSAAHKFMLMVLWGWGPYTRSGPKEPEELDGDRQPAEPVRPYPSREVLAEVTDQPLGTVKNQLRSLARLGWIRRESGSFVTLAWRVPGAFDYGDRTTVGPRGCKDEPDHGWSEGVHPESPPDHECTPDRTTVGPLSSSDLPIHLPEILGDARARPTPPPAHQPLESGRMLATGKPSTTGASSRPTRPDPPGETREARHARLAGQRAAQAELDREAELDAKPIATRMGGLPSAVLDAIAAAPGSWHRELESTAKGGSERETWCESLARAIAERGTDRLTPEAIGRVLVAWAELKGRERDAIPRREIWWSKHWDWAARHVDQRPEVIDWRLVPRPPGEFK